MGTYRWFVLALGGCQGTTCPASLAPDRRLWRRTKLIVINSIRGGEDFDATEALRFEAELLRVQGQLDEVGVEYEVRQLVRGNEPAEDLIDMAADEVNADFIVIGLCRRTPVGKLILGSNAQCILLDASCPVLSVKAGVEDCVASRRAADRPTRPRGVSPTR